ncbi:MAG TPA: oxalate/formate MFS antiporter [Rhodocyclaceae bacterium]|nr:oxalate/formate MFS antiporter [Rhodocyclaceae bacterium]HUY02243.1 oxalate/formate MFS antiporter [Rhodocyclaceae bacterium]
MSATQTQDLTQYTGMKNRWMQLTMGIICMAMIANLQYGWTLFVNPMHDKMGWTKAAIQVAFSVFVLTETWLVPVEGWAMDKFGPRPVVMFGAVLVALAWVMNSMAGSLEMLYVAAVIAGVGAGCVYGTCVGNALKLFPDKRGLAAGLTAAGFGAGAAITIIPISNMVHSAGYQQAFFTFGLLQGGVILVLALFLVRPPVKTVAAAVSNKANPMSQRNFTPKEMLRTPVFWLLYVAFVLVAAGGLMAAAQVAPIAKDYGVAKLPMDVFGGTMPLLTLVLVIDNLCNGFTRPLTGWISDKLGRENTMLVVFTGEGVAMLGLMQFGHDPIGFLIFAPLIFLCWGEIFSIFPAVSGDTFGSKYAAANNGFLYTAKGTASLLVPLASVLKASTGSWMAVLWVGAFMSIAAALLAKFVIMPMRRKMIDGIKVEAGGLQSA